MSIELINEKGITIQDINFNRARAGMPVFKYFKVYNDSDKIAYNVTLQVTGEDEATAWKAFKLSEETNAVKVALLGDIPPNSYYEGNKTERIEFIKDNGMFREVWNTGKIEWHNSSIKFIKNTGDGSGISGARIALDGLGLLKTLDVSFKTKLETDLSYNNFDTTIINFPLRMNSNKDLRGYAISFRRRRSDNKFYAAIYKSGKGMVDNQDRDYGTNLYNTGWIDDYDEDKVIRFKVWNTLDNKPCFEIYLDNKKLTLRKSNNLSITSTTVIDDEETLYLNAGNLFLDYSIWNGDISLEIIDLMITHEVSEQLIAMQTTVDYNAVNDSVHNTELEISYEEDI